MASTELLRMAWAQTWQLTLLVVAILLLVRGFGRNRPHLAHVLWLVVLVKCVTPPLWTSPSGVFCWLQDSAATTPVMEMAPEAHLRAPPIAMEVVPAELSSTTFAERPSRPPQTVEISPQDKSNEIGLASGSPILLWQILIATWLAGAGAILVLAAVRWWSCWRTICRADVESREDLNTLLGNLGARLRLRTRVRLVVTASRIGPAVVGVWRPMILLPAAVVQNKTARELEPILAHELMHVRRGDLWIGMGQVLAQSLWWFHPLVWLANRFLSRDAERCCDEEVIAELGCDPARYARSLLDVLELKRTLQPVPVFPGVRPVEVTTRRLERIMKLGQGCHKRTPWWCWLVMALVAAIALPGAAFVAAGDKTKPKRQSRDVRGGDIERISRSSTDASEVPMLSRSYPVKDVLARIQSDLQQTESDAKQTLEVFLRNMRAGEPESQVTWSGRKLIVLNTAKEHERIENAIQLVRDCGIHQVLIEIHMISGPPEAIDKLHSNWELLDTHVPVGESPGNFNVVPPAPFAAKSPTEFAVRQASVAETTEKRKPALCAVIDSADATAILTQVGGNSKLLTLAAPKIITFTGQTASVVDRSQRPFVVGFKTTADNQQEPQVRVVSSGLTMHLLPLPHDSDQVRLECQFELSGIRSVEEKQLIRGPGQEPLTVQIPEVVATKINLAYDLPLGRTLLIGGLLNKTDEGKPLSTLVMLRCATVGNAVQPSVSQASGTTAVPPAPVDPYSHVPNLQRSPAVYADPEQAAAAQAVHASSPASWVDRLRSLGISLQLPHPVRFNAANEKLELSAGRLRITFGDPKDPALLEADKGVFLPPVDVSKKSEPLTVELSGNVRLHSPGKMQTGAERMRVEITGESSIAALEMSGNVTLSGKDFIVRANNGLLRASGEMDLDGNVELSRKSADGKTVEPTIRAERIRMKSDLREGVMRVEGAVMNLSVELRGPSSEDGSATEADRREPDDSEGELGESSPKPVRKRTIAEALEREFTGEFRDATLRDALLAFEKTMQIRIEIDEEGLRAEGIALDQLRSLQITDVKGLDALQQILKPLNLGIGITSDRLILSIARKAQPLIFTKTYYVADLVVPIPNPVTLVVHPNDPKQSVQANQTNTVKPGIADFKTLIDLIEQTIYPESWAKAGGSGAIESFPTNLSLVISQTEGVHYQIAELLKQLRRLQNNQVSLEPRIVGLPADFFERVGVDIENKTNSTSPNSANLPRTSQTTPQLLNAIQNHQSAKITALPKMTLFNGQTVVLQLGSEGAGLPLSLHPLVSADRRSVTIGASFGDPAKNLSDWKDRQTRVSLVDGDTMMIDLTQSLRPESFGWSASRGVPMFDKIPYLEKLFKNTSDDHIERMYLLITPRIVIREEEEQKLGIDVTP